MTPLQSQLTSLLYAALNEPIGLLIGATDTQRAKAKLYQARLKAKDPKLAELQVWDSPVDGGQLVIVKVVKGKAGTPAVIRNPTP